MLKNYAQILIQVLSNEGASNIPKSDDDTLTSLQISPELKAILYECLHAEDKIRQKEQETYENEISEYILQEKIARQKRERQDGDTELQSDFNELMGFKQAVQKEEEQKNVRTVSRKGAHPKANTKNYMEENKQFGANNDVDLVLQKISG